MKEKKTYIDGMADAFELTLKVFDEMSEAYDILQQVADHQSSILVHPDSNNYAEQIAIISVLHARFENRYWDALDAKKAELEKERKLQYDQ